MSTRLLAFVVWAVVAASAVFWAFRLAMPQRAAPPHTITVSMANVAAGGDLSRLLGAAPVVAQQQAAPADSRFKLMGVVADRQAPELVGLALISVDGKPAKPVEVGKPVEGNTMLLSVGHRRAVLGPQGGSGTVTLELPAVPEPNRSSLPPGASLNSAATMRAAANPMQQSMGQPPAAMPAPGMGAPAQPGQQQPPEAGLMR